MKKLAVSGGISAILLSSAIGVGGAVIAPGVSAAGQELQWMTRADASEAVQEHVESHRIIIDEYETTVRELGYDVQVLDLDSHRAWSVTNWNEPLRVELVPPPDLELKLTDLLDLEAPVDAAPALRDSSWTVVPGENGYTIDFEGLTPTVTESVSSGSLKTEINREVLMPDITTQEVAAAVDTVSSAALDASVTTGDEVLVDITPEEYSSLVSIEAVEGEVRVVPDDEAVASLVSRVTDAAYLESDPGVAVVDEFGNVLKTLESFSDGREVTEEQAAALTVSLKEGLSAGESEFSVEATAVPAVVDGRYRNAVVDRSGRMAYFYENGTEVYRFPVAVGKPGWETDVGSFRVHTQLVSQDMGCGSALYDYCVEDVPWITYFNNDEGFHGTYWHNDFGNPASSARSHGCVNMSPEDAYFVYKFLQTGSPVEVVR